jgi:hypothetical protein
MLRLSVEDLNAFPGTPWGVRRVTGIDPSQLRLFLSLLWRAAATQLEGFNEVLLRDEELAQLRGMVVNAQPQPLDFFPIQLTQLSTRGIIHNLTPIAQEKHVPDLGGMPAHNVPIFRFYFDGLIAHFHRSGEGQATVEELGPLVVGSGPELIVSTVTYEQSFQHENLGHLMTEAYQNWPDLLAKLYLSFLDQ